MADELERPGGEPVEHEAGRLPSPTIWPFAFAAGIALLLIGLVVNWILAAIGAAIALVFGFLWIREATREVRRPIVEPEPAPPVSELAAEEEEDVVSGARALSALGLPRALDARHRSRDRRDRHPARSGLHGRARLRRPGL